MAGVRAVRSEADLIASGENERGRAGNSKMDNLFQEFCYKRELRKYLEGHMGSREVFNLFFLKMRSTEHICMSMECSSGEETTNDVGE